VKALTLHQPWASLVAVGAKTIETRSWSTLYRGPVAIHAGLRVPEHGLRVGDYVVYLPMIPKGCMDSCMISGPAGQFCARLGDVVSTCELLDVVPIGGPMDYRTGLVEGDEGDRHGESVVVFHPGYGSAVPPGLVIEDGDGRARDVSDQLPYGDFAPGRFAWILGSVEPLELTVPARGRQGLWEWSP
jgi:hypothetical protein